MMRLPTVVLALAALGVVASLADADESLTAAAEREKARRAGQQADAKAKPAKTYTDADLKALDKGGSSETSEEAETPSEVPVVEGGPGADLPQDEEPGQGYRGQVAAQRREVEAQQARIKSIETRIAELNAERSRPTRLTEVDRDRSINRDVAEERAKLEDAKAALATAETDLEGIIEEARRAGVPYSQLE